MTLRTLHYEVEEPCACCGLPATFIFASQTDQQVCKRCQRHGVDPTKQVVVHRDLVRAYVQGQRQERATERREHREGVAAAKQETAAQEAKTRDAMEHTAAILATIRKGYAGPDSARVREWVRDNIVKDAEAKRNSAYRARDVAFSALLEVQRHHRADAVEGQCVCGQPIARCHDLAAVERVATALDRWERTQIERLIKGWDHSLPDGHPAIQKHGGIGTGYRLPVDQGRLDFDGAA